LRLSLQPKIDAGHLIDCFQKYIQVARVARFFLPQYTNTGENIPNCHKIYQIITFGILAQRSRKKITKIPQYFEQKPIFSAKMFLKS
jgi:hypothetical protein